MATYTHREVANSPAASWLDVVGLLSTANPSFIVRTNLDGTLTVAQGSFVVVNGQLLGGVVTSVERASADGEVVYETITGVTADASSFAADPHPLVALFGGNDQLYGYSGSDTLWGGEGKDLLVGGAGDDTLIGGAAGDTLIGNDGIDTARYRTSPGGVMVNLESGLTGLSDANGDKLGTIENLIGSNQHDLLIGNAGDNVIEGGLAGDSIDGRGGDDTAVFSHNFNDYILSDFGSYITVHGPDGRDTLKSIEHLKFADTTITPADVADDGNPLFDTLYYLSQNPDVFHAGVNALDHFNTFGWHEGRNPNAFFDTSEYLQVYKDAAASGMNPLEHYHQFGWRQGYDPAADFDTRLYLVHNPDVAAAGVDPLLHFLQFGWANDRDAYAAIGDKIVGGFDAEFYLRHNPDVAAAGVDPLLHFNTFAWHEGRDPNAWFDSAGYLAHYADVAAAGVNPLEHYEQFGWQEGRDPSTRFDTLGYLANNPDVAAAHVNPLDHFLTFGIYEGRQAVNDGVWH